MRISDWSSDVCSSDLSANGGAECIDGGRPCLETDAGGRDLGRQSPLGPPIPDGRDIVVAGGKGRGRYGAGQFSRYGRRETAARTRLMSLRYARPRQVRLAAVKDTGHCCRKEQGQVRGGKRPCGGKIGRAH